MECFNVRISVSSGMLVVLYFCSLRPPLLLFLTANSSSFFPTSSTMAQSTVTGLHKNHSYGCGCGCGPKQAEQISQNTFIIIWSWILNHIFKFLASPWFFLSYLPFYDNPNHEHYWIGFGLAINVAIVVKLLNLNNISIIILFAWMIIIICLIFEQYIQSTYVKPIENEKQVSCPCFDEEDEEDQQEYNNNNDDIVHQQHNQTEERQPIIEPETSLKEMNGITDDFDADRIIFHYIFVTVCIVFVIVYALYEIFQPTDEMDVEQIILSVLRQFIMPF